MKTQRPEILKHMIKKVTPYKYTKISQIKNWSLKTGYHSDYGVFEYDDVPSKAMKLGDTWESTYHRTHWFTTDVEITDEFLNKKLYLDVDFGGEAIVYINDEIVGAISSEMKSGWVHRDKIFLPIYHQKETLHITIESTVNSAGFCDAAMAGATSETYTMQKAQIVSVDEECEDYLIDLNLVYDCLNLIEDRYIHSKVFEALDESLHTVDFDFDESVVRKSFIKAHKVLDDKLGAIKYVPSSKVYMTGHCHIDIQWLWEVRETVRKTARTMANNLALFERYPNFVFTQSQAIVYDFCKQYYPEIFEKIKQEVKKGNWIIEGNSYVEADTNIANGETLIRQLLYGTKFFKEEFGVLSDTYWLPDCFGFSWALPQIIKRSGMKYFVSAKLVHQDTNRFPMSMFKWRGVDGSEILAHIVKGHGYGGEASPGDIVAFDKGNDQSDVLSSSLGMFGYGDGGGGCTFEMIERVNRLNKVPGFPKSIMAKSSDLFKDAEKVKEQLPTWYDEMYFERHRGTYTSQAPIKKYNRKGEILMSRAEMLNSLANKILKKDYQSEKLENTWKLLLKNQFHDTLPGTSIQSAHEDAIRVYEKMTEDGEELKYSALEELNKEISTDGESVVVWNFLSESVCEKTSVKVPSENFVVLDEEKELPCITVKTDEGIILSFIAENVPSMGYKTFKLLNKTDKKKFSKVKATKRSLENEFLKIKFDNNGLIVSLFDKINNRETMSGKGNLLTIFQDKPIHESAWDIELNYQKKFWDLTGAKSIEVICENEIKGVIRIVREFNKSTFTQDIVLYRNAKRVDFETKVDWYETEKTLKAAFEVDIINTKATYEIAHGSIERPTHWSTSYDRAKFEVSAHKWADLSEGGYGVSLLNDCKYGYDIFQNRMRITLMRSPICPDTESDKGVHTFVYSFYPHTGSWDVGDTTKEAFKLNVPLESFVLKENDGFLPEEMSFIETSADNIVIDAFKQAEDGNGFILRVYESKKSRGNVRIKFAFDFEKVIECNMMEENENEIKSDKDSFEFFIKPSQVRTFRII